MTIIKRHICFLMTAAMMTSCAVPAMAEADMDALAAVEIGMEPGDDIDVDEVRGVMIEEADRLLENTEDTEDDKLAVAPESEDEPEEEENPGTYLGNFRLTAYCNCARCCGTAGNPTASGVMPEEGRTVAIGDLPFGTKLRINGHIYTVEDRGTPYGHVDIFMESHEACLEFGEGYADVYLVE